MVFPEHFPKCGKSLGSVRAAYEVVERLQANIGVLEGRQTARHIAKSGIPLTA